MRKLLTMGLNMDINWKKFMMAALIRAIRTFAQTFVSMVAVGAAFSEGDGPDA
ncbi:MAG: hypothetical protein IKG87_13110 [Clostridia bacterium]|nr:hypothetical protein [Clostridia bacterium]